MKAPPEAYATWPLLRKHVIRAFAEGASQTTPKISILSAGTAALKLVVTPGGEAVRSDLVDSVSAAVAGFVLADKPTLSAVGEFEVTVPWDSLQDLIPSASLEELQQTLLSLSKTSLQVELLDPKDPLSLELVFYPSTQLLSDCAIVRLNDLESRAISSHMPL